MAYKIIGISTRTRKKYVSRKTFKTLQEALEWGYKQTYNPSGTKKRKPPFHSWHVAKVYKKNGKTYYNSKIPKKKRR